jgi:hypothetical protein
MIAQGAKKNAKLCFAFLSPRDVGRCPTTYQRIKNPLESHVGNNMRSQLGSGVIATKKTKEKNTTPHEEKNLCHFIRNFCVTTCGNYRLRRYGRLDR